MGKDKSDKLSKRKLPEHLEKKRTRVVCSGRNYNVRLQGIPLSLLFYFDAATWKGLNAWTGLGLRFLFVNEPKRWAHGCTMCTADCDSWFGIPVLGTWRRQQLLV